jgi:hypothetical protein
MRDESMTHDISLDSGLRRNDEGGSFDGLGGKAKWL